MAREKNHSARVQEVLRSRAKSCTTLESAVFKQLQNPTVCRVLNDEKFLARVREFVAARKKKVRERDQLFERYKVASVRGKQLREVQNSLHSIQKRLESLHQRAKGSLDLATGTGKSYVMYGIAAIMMAEGVRRATN